MNLYSSLSGIILAFFLFSISHQIYGQEKTKPDSLFNKTVNQIVTSYNSGDKEKALEQAQKLVNILQLIEESSNLDQSTIGIKIENFYRISGRKKISYNPKKNVYSATMFIRPGPFSKGYFMGYARSFRLDPRVTTSKNMIKK